MASNPEEGGATSVNVSCGAAGLSSSLESISGGFAALLQSSLNIEQSLKDMYEDIKETRDAVVHIHDAHMHGTNHAGEDRFDVGVGGALLPAPAGPSDRLISEFNNNMDYDDNGLIYGKDFIIDENDEDLPQTVRDMHVSMARLPRITMSWQDYLDTIPSEDL